MEQERPEHYSFLDSSLTFAAIWDPKTGLETFSVGLPGLLDTSDSATDSKSERTESKCEEGDEPFAVFGSRQLHFIDVRSSKLYERFVTGDFDTESIHSGYSSDSFYSSQSAPVSYLYLPRPPPIRPSGNDRSSSMVCEGHYSRFLARVKEQDITDEDLFEGSSHADCEPHLHSRFSMSTTFTSAFIAAKTPPIPILERIARAALTSTDKALARKSTVGRRMGSLRLSVKSLRCSACLRPRSIRLSKYFRWSPWFRRPDDKWVLVDIESVVIDRLVNV